jgi:hypothetical protein
VKFYLAAAAGFVFALALTGCAATKLLIADEAAKCGPGLLAAVSQSEQVLMKDTSAQAAVSDIQAILQAAGADVSAVWCVVQVAVDDLKSKPAASQPTTAQRLGMLRTQSTIYPTDPVQHGIALGTDVLKLKP